MFDVFVVGAGISGLSLAYLLTLKNLNVAIVDASRSCGGKIGTLVEDGYVVEKGPNGFLDNKPHTFRIVELLGIGDELIACSDSSKKRYIYLKGRLVEVPLKPFDFIRSPILSPLGKLRILLEPFVPPRQGVDETIAEFGARRLGREFVENLLDPMVTGVYAGDCYKLSLKATFPVMKELEERYGSLFKALIKRKREGTLKTGPSGFSKLYSFKWGLSTLIDALYGKVKEKAYVGLDEGVNEIAYENDHWRIETSRDSYRTKILVLAVPSFVSASLLSFDEELRSLLDGINYVPIVVVAIGASLKEGNMKDGFGFLVPRKEDLTILGCLFDYQIFENRAPRGKLLLRMMVGGARNPGIVDLDSEFIYGSCLYDLERSLGVVLDVDKVWIFRYERGIPQYEIGHIERLSRIEEIINRSYSGLFLHGNAYYGVGMNDCIGNSFLLADRIVESLGRG